MDAAKLDQKACGAERAERAKSAEVKPNHREDFRSISDRVHSTMIMIRFL